MRYLVACDRLFADAPGGGARIAWELAKLARDQGHQVSLVCGSTEADPPPGITEVEGIEVSRYRFPRLPSWYPGRWRAHVRQARLASAALREHGQWDLIHGHMPASATGAWQARGARARLIYTVHSPAVLEQRINWDDGSLAGRIKLAVGLGPLARTERALLDAASCIHVLSDYTARQLRAIHGPGRDAKVVRIPWWSGERPLENRDSARRVLGWAEDATVFFSLRRLVRRMGLDTLIEAAARLDRHRPHLVAIGGTGPERAPLEARAHELGLAGRVAFLGPMTDRQVELAYAACDAFVLPTRALECFGIIAVDALSHGRPVIGSNAGAIPEVLGEVLPGWLFRAGSVKELAERMAAVLDGSLESPAEESLRAHARSRYGREQVGARYRALLEGCGAS